MAIVKAFRGVRYAAGRELDPVVSPPYDVLTAAQAEELRARSPYNALHVDLPVAPGEEPRDAAYEACAATYRRWQAEGILQQDDEPALYLVDQVYQGPDGRERTRRGFVGRLQLTTFDERVVLPHERTHDAAKLDRLRLYRATHADLSQIFLLYPDDDGAIGAELAAAAGAPGTAVGTETRTAHDRDGNLHLITPLRGAHADRIAALLRDRRLYIADGHHRYETALAYRDERRGAGDAGADTLMVYLCAMNDPGLAVFPTHRLVRGLAHPDPAAVTECLDTIFEVTPMPGGARDACAAVVSRLAMPSGGANNGDTPLFALYFAAEDVCCTLRLRDTAVLTQLEARVSSADVARLPVTVLHELLLRRLGVDPAQSEGRIGYVTTPAEAFERLNNGGYQLAAFVPPTEADAVRRVADHGDVMPQKSTYFYPKLLTGLVFDRLG